MTGAAASRAQSGESSGSSERTFFNPWRVYCEQLLNMATAAQDARLAATEQHRASQARGAKRTPSYRGFYVGASVLAFDRSEGEQELYMNTAHNTKTRPDADGICAERRLVDRILRANRRVETALEIVGVVVVAEPQRDDVSGFQSETLWPCSQRCWPGLIHRGKLDSNVLITTVRPNLHKTQVQTAGELDRFYTELKAGNRLREPITVDHTQEDWGTLVNQFDEQFPRNVNPFQSPETRQACVEAARMAIQGYTPLRLVTG
jgi:hypothetical protein